MFDVGLMSNTPIKATTEAIKLVITKMIMVFVRIFDNFAFLSMFAILLVIVKNTSGTTKVNIRLTKISPRGEMPETKLLEAKSPSNVPMTRANSIQIEKPYFFKQIKTFILLKPPVFVYELALKSVNNF